jgi:cytochrome c-type biogenesis protein CcmH/NrfF
VIGRERMLRAMVFAVGCVAFTSRVDALGAQGNPPIAAPAPASAAAPQVVTQDGLRPGTPTKATDPALEARTSAVASGLRCPVCQGLSIQDSPSELAQQMRSLVRDQLAAGKTPDEVRAYFISKYGEWILLEPKATGFNILVYLLPVVLVFGGLVFILTLVRKWTVAPADGDATVNEESRDIA